MEEKKRKGRDDRKKGGCGTILHHLPKRKIKEKKSLTSGLWGKRKRE